MLLNETLAKLKSRAKSSGRNHPQAIDRTQVRDRAPGRQRYRFRDRVRDYFHDRSIHNSTPVKVDVRIPTHSPTEAYVRSLDSSPVGAHARAHADSVPSNLTLADIYPEKLTFPDRTTKCRVFEHNGRVVVESLDPQGVPDLPAAEPGDKILREDGNVYTLGDDAYMLLDDEGYILNPIGLYRWPRQDRTKLVMEISGELRRLGVDVWED